jgi:60 kDa SS-A/Ro ribonucleoprotein
MGQANVDQALIRGYFHQLNMAKIFPFQLITAGRVCPEWEPELEEILLEFTRANYQKRQGKTVILVDVSGSMNFAVALRSHTLRIDAACGIAMMARELFENVEIYSFSDNTTRVAPRRGFALRDAIVASQARRKTMLGMSVTYMNANGYDRIIVITDEQADESDVPLPAPKGQHNYIVNIGTEKNGVGYGKWLHIDGFSQSVMQYINVTESMGMNTTE